MNVWQSKICNWKVCNACCSMGRWRSYPSLSDVGWPALKFSLFLNSASAFESLCFINSSSAQFGACIWIQSIFANRSHAWQRHQQAYMIMQTDYQNTTISDDAQGEVCMASASFTGESMTLTECRNMQAGAHTHAYQCLLLASPRQSFHCPLSLIQ